MIALTPQAHAALAAELKALQTENDRLRGTLARWAKFIVMHNDGPFYGDHACRECRPHSAILIDGFQCAFHEASVMMAESTRGP
jgi:hypothetical protein